ncbi:MAG: polysaccharide biosynthesis/export family protein [Sphingopyxis sp.]|nr:polysaccharide biosynthesis/export family protein [Sphingopyxis sp.]
MNFRLAIASLTAACLLAGCGGKAPQLKSTPTLQVTDGNSLPAPTGTDLVGETRPYLIGPFDRLSVDVYGVPDLSKQVQTDAAGRIQLPLVGEIQASNQTTAQLAEAIEARLTRFVRRPDVSVNVTESVSQVLTVDGQVMQPGLYPVVGKMSLMRAVALAKGTTEFAKLDDVVIFRTVGGQRMAALYNLKQIRQGVYDDPEVFANDVVVVGDSPARRLFKDILATTPLLVSPLVALIR